MVAGLPGTGIGGIFYLMTAICMPIRELPRLMRGKSSLRRWRFILKQWGMTGGIIFGFWITGWVLTLIIPANSHFIHSTSTGNVLKIKPFIISMSVLVVVLGIVELLQFVIPKPFVKKSN